MGPLFAEPQRHPAERSTRDGLRFEDLKGSPGLNYDLSIKLHQTMAGGSVSGSAEWTVGMDPRLDLLPGHAGDRMMFGYGEGRLPL